MTARSLLSTAKSWAVRALNPLLKLLGLAAVPQEQLDELRRFHAEFAVPTMAPAAATPQPEILAWLHDHDTRLQALRAEYRRFAEQDHTVWSPRKVSRGIDLTRFRADNKYMYQGRGAAWFQYLETARYVARHDQLGLGDRITEDGAFGCCRVEADDGRKVSRDWLDSILEINFLEANLGLSRQPGFRVLDVGAGYGRFAHRLVEAFPQVSVCCTDAVAESTFLQEFYVKFRSIEDRVRVLTLPDAADLGPASGFQLAVSIHSFHECPIRWIDWWLRLFERCRIRYLFVVVGLAQGTVSREADGTHVDFLTHIRERGYGLLKEQPKYAGDEIATRLGLFPACYYLFDRDAME